jgi:BirA family biotin operon repressor/biotin-[acetyl-CoA-carboxylase] ligase
VGAHAGYRSQVAGTDCVDGADRRILRFETVPSTQDVIREEARRGAEAGTVAIAEHQTAGRGRRGRTWRDPARGMLMLSYLARPTRPVAETGAIALVAGLVVAETLPGSMRIRWPNDIIGRYGKVAGVLIEGVQSDHGPFAIIGIGINVNVPPVDLPPTDRLPASSVLVETGEPTELAILEADLLRRLDAALGAFDQDGFAALLSRYADRDELNGRPLIVRTAEGTLAGAGAGVDEHGRLLLRATDGTRHALISAEVERVAAADDPTP